MIYHIDSELRILINKNDINIIIPIIMSFNPEDIFIFNLNDMSKLEICHNAKILNPKYLLKNNISNITISFAFPEHSCEICLDLKKYDFRKFELTAKINTDNNISRDIRLFKK